MVGGAWRNMSIGGMEVVWKCWSVCVPGAFLLTVLHPAMLISVSQTLIMQVSVPEMPSISQGHWVAQLQGVPLTVYFMLASSNSSTSISSMTTPSWGPSHIHSFLPEFFLHLG